MPEHSIKEQHTTDKRIKYAVDTCNAIAESPGLVYNPLFISGFQQSEKEFLLTTLRSLFNKKHPNMKIRYITSNQFTADVMISIRDETEATFYSKYETIDVLLVDDIHLFDGREITQDVFFKVFNYMFLHHKQMILVSSIEPKLMRNLQGRMRSRFSWGLIVNMDTNGESGCLT